MLVILFLSIIPLNQLPKIEFELISIDKAVHAFFYATLTFLWWKYWQQNTHLNAKQQAFYGIGIALIYGLFIEYLQEYAVTNRRFETADVLANGIGSLVATAFLWLKNCAPNFRKTD